MVYTRMQHGKFMKVILLLIELLIVILLYCTYNHFTRNLHHPSIRTILIFQSFRYFIRLYINHLSTFIISSSLFLSFISSRAWICIPNVWILSYGKYLFSFIDIIIGLLIYKILFLRGLSHKKSLVYASLFLYSPITVNVSTRGNADSLVCALVLSTVYLLIKKSTRWAAIMYGLAVHMKIYPIVYALPLVLFLDESYNPADFPLVLRNPAPNTTTPTTNGTTNASPSSSTDSSIIPVWLRNLFQWIYRFCTWRRIEFGLISGFTFLILTGIFYYIYGYIFLYETYLYHFIRADNRHNFSAYFYDIYLRYDLPAARTGTGLLSFIPQFGTVLLLGSLYYRDLLFCLFVQTLSFVTWNKVITAQYFQWYLSLLPFLLPQTMLTWKHGILLSLLWLGPEVLSNYWSNELENKGQSVFINIWYSDLLFFTANIIILSMIIIKHLYLPVFEGGRLVLMNNPELEEQKAKEALHTLLTRPTPEKNTASPSTILTTDREDDNTTVQTDNEETIQIPKSIKPQGGRTRAVSNTPNKRR